MSYDWEIETLEDHKRNLRAAQTWEEYRAAHISYIDVVIEFYKRRQIEIKVLETEIKK